MALVLAPQEHLCPLETLLSIYTPILECLVSHLPTPSKLAFSQTSRSIRQILHSYPPFFAHLDFRLSVFESANFDSYQLGTVYNLDRLLQSLPVDGKIVSLTLDWTAVSGSFLFNKILDRCSATLEHLSVRGCRKVSIKHHIVPHFVYQSSILPIGSHHAEQYQRPALKSLYVYKARGVRRKPFLIDRKPADGDEPSRYLTTLAANLGIWLDLGLCPTPKLRCPRRREILRRGKENFCVPFDRRWRLQDDNESLSEAEHIVRRTREQTHGEGLRCWNCDESIPDRCEACVHQMTCNSCEKPLCHNCAYISRAQLGQAVQSSVAQPNTATVAATSTPAQWVAMGLQQAMGAVAPASDQDDAIEAQLQALRSTLLKPCCSTAPSSHADNLCGPCNEQIERAACSLCDKPLCIKHELERCRRCEGGCQRLFCFSSTEQRDIGCGDAENGRAQIKDCLTCGMEVCGACRDVFARNDRQTSAPSPVPSSTDDEDGSESTISAGDGGGTGNTLQTPSHKTTCNCKVCEANYYCPSCWPTKPLPCEPCPATILDRREILDGCAVILQVAFEDFSEDLRWYTPAALLEHHPQVFPAMMEEFSAREDFRDMSLNVSFVPTLSDTDVERSLSDLRIKVGTEEWILERVITVKRGGEIYDESYPSPPTIGANEMIVLCKWLGRSEMEATWERNESFDKQGHPRERALVDAFLASLRESEPDQEPEPEDEEERSEEVEDGSALI